MKATQKKWGFNRFFLFGISSLLSSRPLPGGFPGGPLGLGLTGIGRLKKSEYKNPRPALAHRTGKKGAESWEASAPLL